MIHLQLEIGALQDLLALPERARAAVQGAARDLAAMGHARATELAAQRLRSRRKTFVEALRVQQVDENTFFIVLDASARWVDEGRKAGSMLDDLLKSAKAKIAKDGSRYVVIPLRKGPGVDPGPIQQESVDAIKAEMKGRNIPWAKVERDDSGRPLYGRLHTFDVKNAPVKSGFGPGQGQGPVGAPRQGLSNRGAAVNQNFQGGAFEAQKTRGGAVGHLQGVSVYQRPGANGSVQRDVMTFRVASSKHQGSGRWNHPGTQPAGIFDAVHEWMSNCWTNEMAPAILRQLAGSP